MFYLVDARVVIILVVVVDLIRVVVISLSRQMR
jgi:hypothetical protein